MILTIVIVDYIIHVTDSNIAWLAQLVERDPYTVDVGGSNPSPGTKFCQDSSVGRAVD